MPEIRPPATLAELDAYLEMFPEIASSAIRDFNARSAARAESERNRISERDAFVAARSDQLEHQYFRELRASFRERAEKEFDARSPRIDVPDHVPVTHRPTTKKGRAA